jgi:hypothetical protein
MGHQYPFWPLALTYPYMHIHPCWPLKVNCFSYVSTFRSRLLSWFQILFYLICTYIHVNLAVDINVYFFITNLSFITCLIKKCFHSGGSCTFSAANISLWYTYLPVKWEVEWSWHLLLEVCSFMYCYVSKSSLQVLQSQEPQHCSYKVRYMYCVGCNALSITCLWMETEYVQRKHSLDVPC